MAAPAQERLPPRGGIGRGAVQGLRLSATGGKADQDVHVGAAAATRAQPQHRGKQNAGQTGSLLTRQIEMLQDEIQRAEEQENSLVRIKDLYKDEIRKLMEKN